VRRKILSSKKRQTKNFTPENENFFGLPRLWKKKFRKTKHNFLYISLVEKAQQPTFDFILSSIYKLISANSCPPFLNVFSFPSKRLFGFWSQKNFLVF